MLATSHCVSRFLRNDGKVIYNIITAKSFTDALSADHARTMLDVLKARIYLFSEKQKEILMSPKFDLTKKYKTVEIIDSDDSDEEEPVKESQVHARESS